MLPLEQYSTGQVSVVPVLNTLVTTLSIISYGPSFFK